MDGPGSSVYGTLSEDPPPLTFLWGVYFAVCLVGFMSQAVSALALVFALIGYWRRRQVDVDKRGRAIADPVAAIVPCYLPNEVSVVRETVEHLLYRLRSVERLDVHLVYNTPRELPLEGELRSLAAGLLPEGRRLFVERVPDSTSKAENLNHAIPQVRAKYVAIYDADHRPDPDSLAMAIEHLKASCVDCVQGSTYIRAGFWLGEGLTQAEFFVTYFVMLPLTEALAGTAFFGGANGVWLASSLARLRFDERALTEDIDCFLRALLDHGLTFSFLPECCSGELLPNSLRAHFRQRLRWTMGWDQATLRYAGRFWRAPLPLRKRLGLYYIFVFRWLALLLVAFIVIFNTMGSLRHFLRLVLHHQHRDKVAAPPIEPLCIQRVQLCSTGLYCLFVTYSLLRATLHRPGWRLPASVLVYFLAMPVYILFNAFLFAVSLVRLASGQTGSWIVTSRYGTKEPHRRPLLNHPYQPQHRSPGEVLLAIAFLMQGALAGSIVGYCLGQRTVTEPLWGWVPFGIGATTSTVTDGETVVKGMLTGIAAGVMFFVGLRTVAPRCTCVPTTGLTSVSATAVTEEEEDMDLGA